MEEIGLGQRQNEGRFCGFCYARLSEPIQRKPSHLPASDCRVCGRSTDALPSVASVPADVLAIYLAKRKREGLFVNLFAFLGIFLAMVLSAVLWLVLPGGWWEIIPFVVLIFGAYYLARLFGLWFGASIGYASGYKLRERRWQEFLSSRDRQTANP